MGKAYKNKRKRIALWQREDMYPRTFNRRHRKKWKMRLVFAYGYYGTAGRMVYSKRTIKFYETKGWIDDLPF